ncbi:hypothetical protein BDQ12DRAFT_612294 [Crucibulum laeve]|uniref:Phytanoyl-CoA dioxygenase n=1 Tax=Crucibulum laeve TaxID=68775 RepID=A0A5C3M201_9AGAR|nr:hypothetical protein BDQ12DRAFT_612294 [Crucibulum laeve]
MPSPLKALYDDQGYVIIPGLLDDNDRVALKDACERVIKKTRDGSWPHRRVVGKQFPPYGDSDPDSWGVQHAMHPELKEAAFVRWYTSPKVIAQVAELLDCGKNDLQMELFNILINPLSHNFALRWHRDDVNEKATKEEEQEALAIWHHGVQWNTALYTDSCLFIVPRSHKTPRTEEQRKHSETQMPPEDPLAMPGSICVRLQPGETVFYNSNILHCGTYNCLEKRATLHACMGDARGGSTRARNILQHNLEWMKGSSFRETLPDNRSWGMLDRLIRMQESADGSKFAYSLAG